MWLLDKYAKRFKVYKLTFGDIASSDISHLMTDIIAANLTMDCR